MSLQGIPISDEQCIGDSLEIINSSFQTLDTRTLELSYNLSLSTQNLLTIIDSTSSSLLATIQELSGGYEIVTTNNFVLMPQHNHKIVVLTPNSDINISISTENYYPNHITGFVQLGTGRGIFDTAKFNRAVDYNSATGGINTQCFARYLNSNYPWILEGQLEQVLNTQMVLTTVKETSSTLLTNIKTVSSNAFTTSQTVSSNLTTTLNQISSTLLASIKELSGDCVLVSSNTFELAPEHNHKTIVFIGTNNKTISVKSPATFASNHTTGFLQVGLGRAEFNNISFACHPIYRKVTAGTYTSCIAKFINKDYPWALTGQLEVIPTPTPTPTLPPTPTPVPPPQFSFKLTGPREESSQQTMSVTGYPDTIFFNGRDFANSDTANMIVYVNGAQRLNVSFTKDRLGTPFKYSYMLANGQPYAKLLVGIFAEGDVFLTDSGIPSPTPTPQAVVVTPTPGGAWKYSITGDSYLDTQRISMFTAGKLDTLYFNEEPNPNDLSDLIVNIYVNGGWRSTVSVFGGRQGTPFGYKVVNTNAIITGVFAGEAVPGGINIYLTSSQAPTPTPTPATPTWAHSLTGPREEVAAQTISGTGYADTLYFNSRSGTNNDTTNMTILVNGDQRMNVSFTKDRIGTQFAYSVVGYSAKILGVFAEGEVNLISGLVPQPTPTPAIQSFKHILLGPGGENELQQVSLTTVGTIDALFFNDNPSNAQNQNLKRMLVYVKGKQRSVVDFPEGFIGQKFGYSATSTTKFDTLGTFTDGIVQLELQVPPEPTPVPTSPSVDKYAFSLQAQPGTIAENPQQAMTIVGNPDTIYFNASNTNYEWRSLLVIVNNEPRTSVSYTSDRAGTKFGYRGFGSPVIINGTFPTDETIDYVEIFDDQIPKPEPTPVPTPQINTGFTNKLVGSSYEDKNIISMMNYTGGAEFYYNNRPDPTNSIDKIMNVFVKGVYFATINFFADYIGQSFGFSTFGANYPQFLGVFTEGDVNLTTVEATPVPPPVSPLPSPTPVPEYQYIIVGPDTSDDTQKVSIFVPGDTQDILFFKTNPVSTPSPAEQPVKTNTVSLNGSDRSIITFPEGLIGTTFGYATNRINGAATPSHVGTFSADGTTVTLTPK